MLVPESHKVPELQIELQLTYMEKKIQFRDLGILVFIYTVKGMAWWKEIFLELELKWQFVFMPVVRAPLGQHLQ